MNLVASAAEWLRQGQTLEAQGTAIALDEAVRCYDLAIAELHRLAFETEPQIRRDLAVAWMNRGNALQKQAAPASLAGSIEAYDHAIALLQKLPVTTNVAHGNSLGAAWLNRGHAFQRQGGAALAEAIRSYHAAIDALIVLPADRSVNVNLAAAWMNLANALLTLPAPDHAAARQAAQASLHLTTVSETSDPVMADIGLKARRALCEALGHLLTTAGSGTEAAANFASESSDTLDQGLALVRQWEARGLRQFRPLAARLYRFGTQFYLIHQPHFLADFLLEAVDPERAPGAAADDPTLHAIAAEFVPHALEILRATSLVGLSATNQSRLHEAVRDLEAASLRLTELRQKLQGGDSDPRHVGQRAQAR